jgi:hypothetical protein
MCFTDASELLEAAIPTARNTQSWPNNDRSTLEVWIRWAWMPFFCFVAYALARGAFDGPERLFERQTHVN